MAQDLMIPHSAHDGKKLLLRIRKDTRVRFLIPQTQQLSFVQSSFIAVKIVLRGGPVASRPSGRARVLNPTCKVACPRSPRLATDEGVHKYVDTVSQKTQGRVLPSAGNCSVPCRPRPMRSRGDYSDSRGLNSSFRFGCPRFP